LDRPPEWNPVSATKRIQPSRVLLRSRHTRAIGKERMNFVHLAAAMLALASPNNNTELLDFGADWCGYCRQMEPVVGQLAAQGFPVRKVNVDKDHALAEKYGVQGLPCFILLVNGKEVDRVVGATDRNRLLTMFHRNGVEPEGGSKIALGSAPQLTEDPTPVPFPTADELKHSDSKLAAEVAKRRGWSDPDGTDDAADSSYDRLIRASVRLRIEDSAGVSCGSGTIIDAREGEALILTCGHMFREADKQGKIMVDLFGPGAPQEVPGKLIDYDLKSEVGLLSIETDFPVTVAHLAPQGYAVRKGDHVISVGCDGGADATVRETVVKSINRYSGPANLQVGFQPVQGRSGGGLFTPEGLVVGVCNAGDPADNEGEFSHLSVVNELIERNGLAFVNREEGRPGAPGQGAGRSRQLAAGDRLRKAEAAQPKAERQLQPVAVREPAYAGSGGNRLSAEEKTAIEMVRDKAQDAEVICIVRPLADPKAKSEIIVLDRVSPGFMKHLADEREMQPNRQLTSLEMPRSQAQTAPAQKFELAPWWADILDK
jgi:thiol-disulfide isomerase/thioredoxin